jgi:hypothetical protein
MKELWKSFDIKHAIDIIAEAWVKVSHSFINRVWNNCFLIFVHDFRGFELDEEIIKFQQQCVALAKEVGFDEMEEADVVELLQSHKELSNKINAPA